MQGINKHFPGVRALHAVDLELHSGEVLALLGENGAGKSTLIKILGGVHQPDAGSIQVEGRVVHFHSPSAAQHAGVGIIYQEFNLIPALSVRENIFLGQERRWLGWLPAGQERRQAVELFDRIGVTVDPDAICRRLTVAQQQVVEIAKALSLHAKIIVMDEPSAALSPREVEGLFRIIAELKAQGIGIIYISHRLDEVFALADRVQILRDGEHVGTRPIRELDRATMIEWMVGRKLADEFPPRVNAPRDVVGDGLVVRGLTRGNDVRDVSFDVRRGEIVALTGLIGAGRTETARLIFGADKPDGGSITLDGRELHHRSPRSAIRAGICLLTEDRKTQGLILRHSVVDNFGLPNVARFSRAGVLSVRREAMAFGQHVARLRIKVTGVRQVANTLSGGNQQKIVLAKWLERHADVLIFDEPTRGIDVGAKYEIYQLIAQLKRQGKAILVISSELPEVLGVADRILVMHEGRLTGEIKDVERATQEQIMELAVQ
ncbi:MAG: sugar ABC transporter ATP-binding protein [Planctomycetales bacterium]|nr:sugar ABC transporter ATP-binding protein [Planctomycetales bacterium]